MWRYIMDMLSLWLALCEENQPVTYPGHWCIPITKCQFYRAGTFPKGQLNDVIEEVIEFPLIRDDITLMWRQRDDSTQYF